jgi:hypothetical protein
MTCPPNQPSLNCLPSSTRNGDSYRIKDLARRIAAHVAAGGQVHVKLTSGARAGTIGRVTGVDFQNLYTDQASHHNYTLLQREWILEFDDRKNTIPLDMSYGRRTPGELIFDYMEPTVWVYTTVPKEKKDKKKLYDHFGTELEIGMVCMFVAKYGKNDYRLRFGKLTRTSEVGTMWFKPMRTQATHREKEEDLKVEAAMACSVTVMDADVRQKVMISKLAL